MKILSVKKHISSCQNKYYKGIEIKTIVYENNPANLRLFEAFYINFNFNFNLIYSIFTAH